MQRPSSWSSPACLSVLGWSVPVCSSFSPSVFFSFCCSSYHLPLPDTHISYWCSCLQLTGGLKHWYVCLCMCFPAGKQMKASSPSVRRKPCRSPSGSWPTVQFVCTSHYYLLLLYSALTLCFGKSILPVLRAAEQHDEREHWSAVVSSHFSVWYLRVWNIW